MEYMIWYKNLKGKNAVLVVAENEKDAYRDFKETYQDCNVIKICKVENDICKPIKKKQKDLVQGDIIRIEYGDYDNFITLVVDCATSNCVRCHYLDGRYTELYGNEEDLVDIVGWEE